MGVAFPGLPLGVLYRYWVFVFPSAFWFMVSWNLSIISFGVGVCVSFVCMFSMGISCVFLAAFCFIINYFHCHAVGLFE